MAYDFGADQHNNRVNIGDILDAPTACTLSCWIFIDEAPSAASSHIMVRRDGGTSDGWALRIATNLKPDWVTIVATSAEVSASSAAITVDKWTHLLLTWDGSDVVFYIDGTSNTTAHTKACGATTRNADLGAWNGNGRGVDCHMSDIMFWTTALSAVDAASAYAGGIPAWDSLVGWWPGHGSPGYNLIDGTAAVEENTIAYLDSVVRGNPSPGRPQPQLMNLGQPHIHRQDVNLVPDIPSPDLEETVVTSGTSSETVVIPEPNGITTIWTKGYSSITTVWTKGPNSYA